MAELRRIEKGVANIVFSTQPIEMGGEDRVPIRERFESGEPIYGRVYLPGPLGANVVGQIRAILIVDNDRKMDEGRSAIDATWDQFFLDVTDDEHFAPILRALPAGKHRVVFWVTRRGVKTGDLDARVDAGGNLQVTEEIASKILSSGGFDYVVKG